MSVLTYLIDAQITDAKEELDGKTLSIPTLSMSDGTGSTYCVSVDVGQDRVMYNVPIASGVRELTYADVGSAVRLRRSVSGRYEVVGFSKRMPGTYTSTPVVIRPRPFSAMLLYTGPQAPEASEGVVIGVPEEKTIMTRYLSYDELAAFGGYGAVPYGALALFEGGVFKELIQ